MIIAKLCLSEIHAYQIEIKTKFEMFFPVGVKVMFMAAHYQSQFLHYLVDIMLTRPFKF